MRQPDADTNAHTNTNTGSVTDAGTVADSDTGAKRNNTHDQRVSLAWSKRR